MRKAIEELPLKFREIIILREIEGMSYSEMSKILNESLANVRTILFRARQQLKKNLLEITTQNSKIGLPAGD